MRQSRKKWERRREVHRNKLAAVIFVIMMIAFCVVNLATGDREFSATENRALEQRPELTISGIESGRWMEQYEAYVSDQFAGRDFWVMLKSRVDLLAGKRKANGVFKGKDHYLLEDIAKPASIISTFIRSNCLAICNFSLRFILHPGDCSPSLNVVSKILIINSILLISIKK